MLTFYRKNILSDTPQIIGSRRSILTASIFAVLSGAASACSPPLVEAQVMHRFADYRLDRADVLSTLGSSLVIASGEDIAPVSIRPMLNGGLVLSFCVPRAALKQSARLRVGEKLSQVPELIAASSPSQMALVPVQSAPNHAIVTDVRRGRPDGAAGVVVAFTLHNAGTIRGTLSSRVNLSWEVPNRPCSDPDPRSIEIDLEIGLERQRAVWREGRAIFEDDISAESSVEVRSSGAYDLCIGYLDLEITPPALEISHDADVERIQLIVRMPADLQDTMGGTLELEKWELTFVNEDVRPMSLSGEL